MDRAERCGTLKGCARLLGLVSKLGHNACEKATERTELTGPKGGPVRLEVELALKKIYGKPRSRRRKEAVPLTPHLHVYHLARQWGWGVMGGELSQAEIKLPRGRPITHFFKRHT